MELLEELSNLGVDVKDGLERVMGDTSLYEMMLGMFVDAVNNNPISLADFDGDDLDGLIKSIHTLKGITGNLGLTPLFQAYNQSLILLRDGKPSPAKKEFEQILSTQVKIIECITSHQGV